MEVTVMKPRILVLTTEPLPLPGLPATGAGLRAWGLGFGLRSAGFEDVVLGFAADSARGVDLDLDQIPGIRMFERSQLDDFIASVKPDAVVFQHWGLWSELKRPLPCPVAMDLAGPHLLERRLWGSADPAGDLRQKLTALAAVDHTVCSGEFQRHYFIPFLVQAGHDPRSHLCPVIPFSLSPDLPEASLQRERDTLLFGGMFLPWQDPEATLRTVVETLEEKRKGKLVFIGGPHPAGDVSGGRFDTLMEFLEKSDRVEIHRTMSFDKYLETLCRCGLAIDLMPRNAERELAFPTRTVGYLWAGLPVIHNNYDELAEPISRARAGWAMDANDRDGLKKLLVRILGHKEDIERRAEKARELVTENYTWDRTIGPLAGWCENPKPRAEKRAPIVAVAADTAPAEPRKKRRREGKVQYAPPTPMADTASRGAWYLAPIVFTVALPISICLLLLFAAAELVRLVLRRK